MKFKIHYIFLLIAFPLISVNGKSIISKSPPPSDTLAFKIIRYKFNAKKQACEVNIVYPHFYSKQTNSSIIKINHLIYNFFDIDNYKNPKVIDNGICPGEVDNYITVFQTDKFINISDELVTFFQGAQGSFPQYTTILIDKKTGNKINQVSIFKAENIEKLKQLIWANFKIQTKDDVVNSYDRSRYENSLADLQCYFIKNKVMFYLKDGKSEDDRNFGYYIEVPIQSINEYLKDEYKF